MENKKKAGALLLTTGLAGVAASTAQTNVTSAGFMDWVREKGSSLADRSVRVMSKAGKALISVAGYLGINKICKINHKGTKYSFNKFYGIDEAKEEAKEKEKQIRACAQVVRDELEKELKINIDEKIVDEVYNKVNNKEKFAHSPGYPEKRMQDAIETVKENLDKKLGILRDYYDKEIDMILYNEVVEYPREKKALCTKRIYQGIKEIMSMILQDRMKKTNSNNHYDDHTDVNEYKQPPESAAEAVE